MKEITQSKLEVQWILTRQCNYRCKYCPKEYRNNEHYIYKDLEKSISALFSYVSLNSPITILGGEPTVHPQLREIIKLLHQYQNVQIMTNFSESLWYYRDLLEINPKLKFFVSYHPTEVELEPFVNKLMAFRDKVSCAVMLYEPDMEQIKQLTKKLDTLNIKYQTYPLLPWTEPYEDFSHLNFIEKLDDRYKVGEAFSSKIFKGKTWYEVIRDLKGDVSGETCYCTTRSLIINSDGGLYNCFTATEKSENQKAQIEKLRTVRSYMKNRKEIVCSHRLCKCDWELTNEN